jgi:hypothetical protein
MFRIEQFERDEDREMMSLPVFYGDDIWWTSLVGCFVGNTPTSDSIVNITAAKFDLSVIAHFEERPLKEVGDQGFV